MVNSSIKKRREKILAILKEKKYISVHSLQKNSLAVKLLSDVI